LNRIAQAKSIGAAGTIAEYLAETKNLARPIVMVALPFVKPALLIFGKTHRHVSRDDEHIS
jgi:hypothetical protein